MFKKIFTRDKNDAPNKPVNLEKEIKSSHLMSKDLYTFNENKVPSPEDRKGESYHRLIQVKKERSNERISQEASEENNDEFSNDIANQESEKKSHYTRKRMMKYFRGVVTNLTETMQNIKIIGRKDEMPNIFKSKTTQILSEEKCISKMDKCSNIINKKRNSRTKLEVFEDSKFEFTDFGYENTKADMLANLRTQSEASTHSKYASLSSYSSQSTYAPVSPYNYATNIGYKNTEADGLANLRTQSEISINSKYVPLSSYSSQSTFAPVSPYNFATSSHSSTVRSEEEVWAHFKLFMAGEIEAWDRVKPDQIQKKGIKTFSKSGVCDLDDAIKTREFSRQDSKNSYKTTSESASPSLKNYTNRVTPFAMTKDSEFTKEGSVAGVDNLTTAIKNTEIIPRQRIVYDERIEYIRGWIIQQIKDKQTLLKYKIMKGIYSKDTEKKMKRFKKAECLQKEAENFLNALDNSEKVKNVSNHFEGYSDSSENDDSDSPREEEKHCIWPEQKSFKSLFLHLYKSSSSEEVENVFKWVNPTNLTSAFENYLVSKKDLDIVGEFNKYIALTFVDNLHFFIMECRLNMKCEMAHQVNTSLEDYRIYIEDLKMAVNENLNCLKTIIPIVKKMIFPLFYFLNRSKIANRHLRKFLKKERLDIFQKKLDKNYDFFEKFCDSHFKNR